ncbi:hypothetical protein EV128_1064 [Rhizobium azibense]|nr:hypothetical protein EV128_1064 [Rhizobium azibense]
MARVGAQMSSRQTNAMAAFGPRQQLPIGMVDLTGKGGVVDCSTTTIKSCK